VPDFSTFSAKEWITANVPSATYFTPDTLNAIENFTVMWHVFEGLLCSSHADMNIFEELAVEIVKRRRCRAELERIFTYYQKRYYETTGFTPHFKILRFHSKSQKEFVEAVVSGKKSDFESTVLALLIILHRMRKTLFHGLPALDMLNSQAFSMYVGCHALATIIEAHGRHFKRERYAEQFPG
jgi:hypothetical protein